MVGILAPSCISLVNLEKLAPIPKSDKTSQDKCVQEKQIQV